MLKQALILVCCCCLGFSGEDVCSEAQKTGTGRGFVTCHAKFELPSLAICSWPLHKRILSQANLWPDPAAILRQVFLNFEGNRRDFQMHTSKEYFHQMHYQCIAPNWEGEDETKCQFSSNALALPAAPSFPNLS